MPCIFEKRGIPSWEFLIFSTFSPMSVTDFEHPKSHMKSQPIEFYPPAALPADPRPKKCNFQNSATGRRSWKFWATGSRVRGWPAGPRPRPRPLLTQREPSAIALGKKNYEAGPRINDFCEKLTPTNPRAMLSVE